MLIRSTPAKLGSNQNNDPGISERSRLRRTEPAIANFLYSPKKAALAIGVSESSMKRWCDAGDIDAVKTVGGHRRVARAEVIAFLKGKKYSLLEPLAIGLPDVRDINVGSIQDGQRQFLAALRNGDESLSRKLLVCLFIDGQNVAGLFDRFVAPVFLTIGKLKQNGQMEIYQARVANQICLMALHDVQSMLPLPSQNAPTAIGATLDGDPCQLSTVGVQMCLSYFGWHAKWLGSDFSLDSLYRAVVEYRPDAVWISLSHNNRPAEFVRQVNRFCQQVGSKVTVIIGGMALNPSIRSQLKSATCCDSFAQLAMLIRTLKKTT